MRAIAWLSALLLIACAGAPPPRTHYLLRADAPDETVRVKASLPVALGQIAIAAYLDQPGLVVETEAHQVRPASYHHWAEPLDQGLRRLLRAEISNALGEEVSATTAPPGEWDYVVDVRIDQLHGTLSGDARLTGGWRLLPRNAEGEVAVYRFARSAPLPRKGYAGLVEAEIGLVRQLAVAIADSLREVAREAESAP